MKFQFAIPVITTVVVAFSCGSNGNPKDEKGIEKTETVNAPAGKLDGAWVIRRAEGSMADMNLGTVYSFEEGKLSFSQAGYNNPGKTNITDSTFSFQADGNELHFMYNYHFADDTLVVAMQNSGQTFYMTRQ